MFDACSTNGRLFFRRRFAGRICRAPSRSPPTVWAPRSPRDNPRKMTRDKMAITTMKMSSLNNNNRLKRPRRITPRKSRTASKRLSSRPSPISSRKFASITARIKRTKSDLKSRPSSNANRKKNQNSLKSLRLRSPTALLCRISTSSLHRKCRPHQRSKCDCDFRTNLKAELDPFRCRQIQTLSR